jgi:hypothetical protein
MPIKLWYQSKGVWGSLVGMLAGVLTLVGVDFNQPLQAEAATILTGAGELVGGALALWGRVTAMAAIVWVRP